MTDQGQSVAAHIEECVGLYERSFYEHFNQSVDIVKNFLGDESLCYREPVYERSETLSEQKDSVVSIVVRSSASCMLLV